MSGHLVLDGTLKASSANGFVPEVGDVFRVLNFSSRSSGFRRDEGLALNGDPFLQVVNGDQSLALVTRSFQGSPPVPATNLYNQVVAVGAPATFRIEPLGQASFSYRWQFNANTIPRATNSTFTIASAQTAHSGLYSVLVTDGFEQVTTYSATLSVLLPPGITVQPAGRTVAPGTSVTLNATISGDGPFNYQWRLNGANIPGVTNASYTISSAQPANGGSYSVTVANPVGAVVSAIAVIAVTSPPLPFADNLAIRSITNSVAGVGSGSNTNATMELDEPDHAEKSGGRSVWYSWRAPANGIATFSTRGSSFDTLLAVYVGSTLADLIPVAGDDDRGGFFTSQLAFQATAGATYLIAIDGFSGAIGNIILSWNLDTSVTSLPRIVAHPANRTVASGANTSFTVLATSTVPLSYQWLFNDYLRIEGATSATLVLTNVHPAAAGRYNVEITNANGQRVRSEAANLEVGTDTKNLSEDKFRDLFGREGVVAQLLSTATRIRPAFPSVSAGTIGTQILNNFNSTVEQGEALHGGVVGGSSRWFMIKALEQATMVIDTVGSGIDTVLGIYTGTNLLALRKIASDNDGAPDGLRSRVRFQAEAGTDYLIAVDGVKGAQGDLVLNWGLGEAPVISSVATDQTVRADGTVTFSVAAAGRPNPYYQWQFNGRDLAGETNTVLVLRNVTATHAGVYRARIGNFIDTLLSAPMSLTVEQKAFQIEPGKFGFENGQFHLVIEGTGTQKIVIEVTRDLNDLRGWIPVWTNSKSSPIEFTDTEPILDRLRIYRARTQP